jgi:hypothetical protein
MRPSAMRGPVLTTGQRKRRAETQASWRLINSGYAIAYRLQKRAAFPGREPVSARHLPPLDRPPWDLGTTVWTEPSHLVILDLGRREIMRVGSLGREHEHNMPRRTLIWEPLPYIFALRKRHEGENSSLAA